MSLCGERIYKHKDQVAADTLDYLRKNITIFLGIFDDKEIKNLKKLEKWLQKKTGGRKLELPKLSDYEWNVVKLLSQGFDTPEIAEKLNKTKGSVSGVITFICSKFEFKGLIKFNSELSKKHQLIEFLKKNKKLIFPDESHEDIEDIKEEVIEQPTEGQDEHSNKLIEPLTNQEMKVLELLCQGYGYKEAANQLICADTTLKTHVNNIFQKLQVNNRIQAVLYAIKSGLVDIGVAIPRPAQVPSKSPPDLSATITKFKEKYAQKIKDLATEAGLLLFKGEFSEETATPIQDQAKKIKEKIDLLEEIQQEITA